MRLRGGKYYLVLRRSQNHKSHNIEIYKDFDRVLASWEAGTRVSPVFALEGSTPPNFRSSSKSWLLFFGPVPPRVIASLPTPHCFLSLGLYNFVVFSTNPADRDAALSIPKSLSVSWEEWELSGNGIDDVQFSALPQTALTQKHVKLVLSQPKALQETLREYVSVLATSLSRAEAFAPHFVSDLHRFDQKFRFEILADPKASITDKQRLLVLANAALSRHSSQTFAGTSPLFETECHFWTHSLLGVGMASLALLRARQFLESVVSRGRLIERLTQLASEPPYPGNLENLVARERFWDDDHLFKYASQKSVPDLHIPGSQDVLPLITCFSGRDGFRSTFVSLSAPLEVISCCNTTEWTLLTLTHESSHNIVYGFLGQLLPNVYDAAELLVVIESLGEQRYPTLLAQLRALLCFGIWRLSKLKNQRIGPRELSEIILRHWQTVNEVLTHCLDFLYFYRREPSLYISSVWASWGVVPNIQSRVSAYVVRCLCAIHTINISRDNGIELSISSLETELNKARRLFPNAPYIEDALNELRTQPVYFRDELKNHEVLIKMARYIFYSSQLEKFIFYDSHLAGGRGRYPFKPLVFGSEVVENPLRFIAEYASDAAADGSRSLWLLHQIAFGKDIW